MLRTNGPVKPLNACALHIFTSKENSHFHQRKNLIPLFLVKSLILLLLKKYQSKVLYGLKVQKNMTIKKPLSSHYLEAHTSGYCLFQPIDAHISLGNLENLGAFPLIHKRSTYPLKLLPKSLYVNVSVPFIYGISTEN